LIIINKKINYSWGSNQYGKLGIKSNVSFVPYPILVYNENFITRKIISIYAGVNHVLILCDDNKIFSVGYNLYGQLVKKKKKNNIVLKFKQGR
jgi:alpha-tubulin suppressor-like RCC1 family protein